MSSYQNQTITASNQVLLHSHIEYELWDMVALYMTWWGSYHHLLTQRQLRLKALSYMISDIDSKLNVFMLLVITTFIPVGYISPSIFLWNWVQFQSILRHFVAKS